MNEAQRRSVLLEFARQECANHVHSGVCEPRDRKPCRLGQGERCSYFEACVLPIAVRKLRMLRKPKKDDSAVVDAYIREHPELRGRQSADEDASGRTCPDCGEPLVKRQRVCLVCRAKRRRQSDRQQKARTRGGCPTVNSEKGGQNRLF